MTQVALFVGIDVAKDKLDWCIRAVARATASNSPDGCAKLAAELKARGVTLAVMEASGGYERTMAAALRKQRVPVRIVDPKRIKDFARAAGRRAKNDPIDANTIAWFAHTFTLAAEDKPDKEREHLAALVAERQDLVEIRTQCLNRNQHKAPVLCQHVRKNVLNEVKQGIAKLDAAIAAWIAKCPRLAARARLLASVPGLGRKSVAALLAWLPELGHITRQQIAALLGVAPFDNDSGEHASIRHIAGGRRQLRNSLYMPLVGAATQHNPILKKYFKRLLASGKLKKVAILACMRKLIVILNVMLAREQSWNPQPTSAQP